MSSFDELGRVRRVQNTVKSICDISVCLSVLEVKKLFFLVAKKIGIPLAPSQKQSIKRVALRHIGHESS
jgi:hypothetical protein